jgi:hypothetical protein
MAEHTPKALLEALDLVRSAAAPKPEALGRVRSLHVQRVRSAFEDPNIVAIGIAEKVTDKKTTGELSLCFYVEKKKAKKRIAPDKLVPPVVSTPSGAAVFTDVQVIGRVVPQKINRRRSPLQSGYSVGHVKITAGTLGAIVRKGKTLYLLSNSHVLALSGTAKKGDKVTYPGPDDLGSSPEQIVGTLADFEEFEATEDFVNHVDAALARIDKKWADKLDLSIFPAKPPFKLADPVRGMKIAKRGRTTGDTEGTVRDVNFSIAINYDEVGKVGFIDQVLCTRYSRGGDSGAIVADKKSGAIVGLHFAGSEQGSVFNPIKEVVKRLKFRFVNP